jgi:Predicted signal transduction protein with a C-terminal ATPase domain
MKTAIGFYKSLKIRARIIIIYITLFIVSLVISVDIFTIINEKKTEREVGELAMQTTSALKGNLGFIFENVTQFSNLIYYDRNLEKALTSVKSPGMNISVFTTVKDSLVNILSGKYTSSAFIIDNYNNFYSSNKEDSIPLNAERIKQTKWYHDMKDANGKALFINKSEGVLSYSSKNGKGNYITLVREIRSTKTFERLGILMIVVDEKTIQNYFNEVGKKYNSQFFIVDLKGNYIIKPPSLTKEIKNVLRDSSIKNGYQTVKIADSKTIVVKQELSNELNSDGWYLMGTIPMNSNTFPVGKAYGSWIMMIILLNLFFVFTCSIVLTRQIFNPLSKIQKHMKLVEQGQLTEMKEEMDYDNEINDLRKVFNRMVISIRDLIEKVKNEEKIILKNELEIINAQINPHFLYNTLDAVSALALLEDNQNCFKMTQALGNFYRNSLNSGKNLISIKDEIDCIESYITILNIRYDNKIILQCEMEEEIKEEKILKLILQPIVENAVHHGLRMKKGEGTITIRGYRDEDELIFSVMDDGLGIAEDKINEILTGNLNRGKHGFGLYSSIQRISLFYGIERPIMIASEIGIGTEITVRVKVIEEEKL